MTGGVRMYANLKVVKLGDYVKITSINLKTSSRFVAEENKKHLKKLENNIIRAKNNINEIALSNDFIYFFTLTFNTSFDRYNLDMVMNEFRNHLKTLSHKIGKYIKYCIVPEQHKDGAWHFHGFFTEDIDCFLYYNEYGYLSVYNIDNLGYMNINKIKDKLRVSSYVTKYITKNLSSGIELGRHCFYASKGLSRGEELEDFIYDNEFFRETFFSYSNDFCSRRIITMSEYEKLKVFLDKLKVK